MKKILLLLSAFIAFVVFAEPFFVDISGVVNTSRTDDGIANNGEGGWTDEGINDMETYPPVPVGKVQRNNYWINFIDPAQNGGKDVIGLKRSPDDTLFNLPESVTIAVPNKKAKYVYFYHIATRYNDVKWGGRVAVYTVNYADGTKADKEIALEKNIHPWYLMNWWDNCEAESWPVHMSWNCYSVKWGKFIGITATRFINPSPDKEIASITLKSDLANCQPMIFGITLDDEDYYGDPNDKSKREGNAWGRPGNIPDGYYTAKMEAELIRKYAAAKKIGLVKGIVSVEIYRPDLIGVSVGSALAKNTRPSTDQIKEALAKKPFKLVSKNDSNYKGGFSPSEFGRFTYEYWNGNIKPFPAETIFHSTLYFKLPQPLVEGKDYELIADFADNEDVVNKFAFKFGKDTPNPAIKINQVSYLPNVKKRWAYLGWWAGDMGTVDYAAYPKFEVYKEGGKKVLEGDLVKRVKKFIKDPSEDDFKKRTGEDIYEMDISALGAGDYRIKIPGLGWSDKFSIGDKQKFHDLYYHVNRVFLHQRCGQELKKPWSDRVRKACHVWTEKSGKTHSDEVPGAIFTKGGYHDAADYDCFTYHLRATQQVMDAYEMFPEAFKDGDLDLPESGNKIPDVLDEARWALSWYRDTQYPDGSVHHGRCNECDSARQGFGWDDYGFFKPWAFSSFEYAAVASVFARHYAKFDKKEANTFVESAKKAYDWAVKNRKEGDKGHNAGGIWAASELYFTTKDKKYLDDVKMFVGPFDPNKHWEVLKNVGMWDRGRLTYAFWHYALYDDPALDPAIRKALRNWYINDATQFTWGEEGGRNNMVNYAYRPKQYFDWAGGSAGGNDAEPKLRAWYLTRNSNDPKEKAIAEKCLEFAAVCMDFQLGCNALSRTFVTGMGYRPPIHPQISPDLYSEGPLLGDPVPGYVPFGICNNRPRGGWYPGGDGLPYDRRYADIGAGSAEYNSEFTINETIGPNAMMYSIFWALTK